MLVSCGRTWFMRDKTQSRAGAAVVAVILAAAAAAALPLTTVAHLQL